MANVTIKNRKVPPVSRQGQERRTMVMEGWKEQDLPQNSHWLVLLKLQMVS